MRLAQVARNLSITTEDIVSFLSKKDIQIIKDSNTKLDENSLELIYAYYGRPEEEIKVVAGPEEATDSPAMDVTDTIADEAVEASHATEELNTEETKLETAPDQKESEEEAKPQEADEVAGLDTGGQEEEEAKEALSSTKLPAEKRYKTVTDLLEEQENESTETIEDATEEIVIKAAKVNLQGLNILGKIDLPAPKEKKEVAQEERLIRPNTNKKNDSNRPPKRGIGKNRRKELSPQDVRLREKKAAERKKKAEASARKKQREEFYTENVLKPKQQQQKKKQAKKKPQKTSTKQNKTTVKPAPKTVLGKFWRWLNT